MGGASTGNRSLAAATSDRSPESRGAVPSTSTPPSVPIDCLGPSGIASTEDEGAGAADWGPQAHNRPTPKRDGTILEISSHGLFTHEPLWEAHADPQSEGVKCYKETLPG